MPQRRIELANVLELVRNELIKANDAAFKSGRPVMVFDECEVEFAVEVAEELNVGMKMYFLSLGGKQKKSDSNTVTVKFKALENIGLIAAAGQLERPAAEVARQTTAPKGARRGRK